MRQARFKAGMITIELVVAIGILASTMLPLAYSITQEQRLARGYYYRAIAIEIIDGEMEVLLAGEWRAFPSGRQAYQVHAEAAKNLPPGQFLLSILESELKLEWLPNKPGHGGPVFRNVLRPVASSPHPISE